MVANPNTVRFMTYNQGHAWGLHSFLKYKDGSWIMIYENYNIYVSGYIYRNKDKIMGH